MVVFSLREPIAYEKLIKRIDELLKKEIKSQNQAANSVLVISVKEITTYEECKKLN
jgi:hypothetical protein